MKMLAHDNAMPSGDSVIGKLQNDFVLMNAKLDEIVIRRLMKLLL